MRKVIMFNMMTLDGIFEGPNADISWHQVDDEFNEFAVEQLKTVDMILFGRVTYEGMASYWTTPNAIEDDPIVAGNMNSFPKIVFSRTLNKAEWNNTRLIKENISGEVQKLKQQPGKDMIIFGSANLVASFAKLGLIDEYRIIVNPVILGEGMPLFKSADEQLKLHLLKSRAFANGNVLLYYQPAPKA